MDEAAKKAITAAEKELRIAKAALKIVRALAKAKPHLRIAILEIAADRAGVPLATR